MSRKQCSFCGELLAPSAYYRHATDQTGSVCPGKCGKVAPSPGVVSESDDDLSFSSSHSHLDSSFDFGSVNDDDMQVGLPFACMDDPLPSTASDDFPETDEAESSNQESGDKIWTSSDEEDGQQEHSSEGDKAVDILSGNSLFLAFFD